MDILEFSKNMELEGSDYYLKLAHDTQNPELSGVFTWLAQEELEHYNLFASWKDNAPPIPGTGTDILGKVKSIFTGMAAGFNKPEVMFDAEIAYRKALELEHGSISHYRAAREHVQTQDEKMLFDFLVHEELKHVRLIENLIDFVRRPKEWLENAEFNHLDDY
jgi:rubrerythrin